jgi:hypothetical protein
MFRLIWAIIKELNIKKIEIPKFYVYDYIQMVYILTQSSK